MILIVEVIDSLILFIFSILCFVFGTKPSLLIKKDASINNIKKKKKIFIIISIILFLIGVIRLINNIML